MKKELIPAARIAHSIYLLRGQKIILDSDLAHLYGVAAKVLNQAVKRNRERFPDDFMFQLTAREIAHLKSQLPVSSEQDGGNKSLSSTHSGPSRSQIVTLKRGKNIKYRPYAFTEQGVAMLSSVLKSGPAWGAHASRVLVSVSRRNDLSIPRRYSLDDLQSPRWRDAITNPRDARDTQT